MAKVKETEFKELDVKIGGTTLSFKISDYPDMQIGAGLEINLDHDVRCLVVNRKWLEEFLLAREECEAALHETDDVVNRPAHYRGKTLECIDVIHDFDLNYDLGNAVKYILRSGKKGDKITDLKKAVWYLQREIGNE